MRNAPGKTDSREATPEEIGQAAKGAAGRVLEGIRTARFTGASSEEDWRRSILWVDDRPDNTINERRALESMGFSFSLAETTKEALDILSHQQFAAIISDMGRREGPREGYALLGAIRGKDERTPFFIYAGSNALEHRREAAGRGAQGTTNRPDELFDMVTQALA
jgi:DNA-binding NtrC family response regulator